MLIPHAQCCPFLAQWTDVDQCSLSDASQWNDSILQCFQAKQMQKKKNQNMWKLHTFGQGSGSPTKAILHYMALIARKTYQN